MPAWAQHLVTMYGYLPIFVLVTVEGLGLPLPGETLLIVGAALAGAGILDIRIVISVAATGAILGDSGGYWVGRRWGRQVLVRWGPKIGLTRKRFQRVERLFRRYGLFAVFFGRYQAIFRTYIGMAAGMAHMPFLPFFLVRFASCIVWAALYGILAYYLGRRWSLIESLSRRFGLVTILILVALIAIAAIAYWVRRRHMENVSG